MKHPVLVIGLSMIILAAIFGFNACMMHLGDVYIASGEVISEPMLILFGVSGFLHRFWWLLTPLIFGFSFMITEFLSPKDRSKSVS